MTINTLVILAGGRGTRFMELTKYLPKPLIKINKIPIISYIIYLYILNTNISKIIICGGYKYKLLQEYIKKISANKFFLLDKQFNKLNYAPLCKKKLSKLDITVVNTGIKTQTGGRLNRIKKYIIDQENFFFTYGDGISNVNLNKLLNFHLDNNSIVTLSAVLPPERYGVLSIDNKSTCLFQEKKKNENNFINGGFFVVNKRVFECHFDDTTSFELDILTKLSKKKKVFAFKHHGYWRAIDSSRDRINIENDMSVGTKIF